MSGRLVIAGGSGFIGRAMASDFASAGYEVVVLSRSGKAEAPARGVRWDGATVSAWASELRGAAVVVNLSGEPVTLPWTPENKKRIIDSRVRSTRAIGDALRSIAGEIPPVWINASAIGYYGDRGEELVHEDSGPGQGFLPESCQAWESAFDDFAGLTRMAKVRVGVVLGRGGGAFEPLQKLTKGFLGGAIGSGQQWMSWIHLEDLVKTFRWIVENPEATGPYNAVSPNPARNGDLMKTLRHVVGRPWSPPAPAFAMKLVGKLGGPDPSILLDSTRVDSRNLREGGFAFRYPELEPALRTLI